MLIDKELYERVVDITGIKYFNDDVYSNGNKYAYIDDNGMTELIEDLLSQIDILQEQYDDLEQDLHDNYRPLPRSEYTGDSYDDRFG